ncbi:hypothetical protein AAG570_007472 [Ranatra chinensis]|uniref:Reverse transcriptase domain-containing protein n=1 Tax=Ranatra chinensis TaxID=642074 RepID=A0ABD0XVZ6_9HEMI
MDEFLEGLDPNAIQVYMDDIIVFSKSEAEHCTHLGQLLKRLREFGLKASEEKSSFFQAELKFMGHTVSASGVSANREKVEAVKSLPVPKEVKSFQGMVGYYRKFIPNLADRLAPWTRLLRKGVKFVVTADMIEEFNRIKEALTNAETRYPAIERELLGVVWGVQQFRPYLWGRHFTVRTDHKPLVWVDELKENSARVTLWKETLATPGARKTWLPIAYPD